MNKKNVVLSFLVLALVSASANNAIALCGLKIERVGIIGANGN